MEMVEWMKTHDISLTEKFHLENTPKREKKHKKRKSAAVPEAVLDLHGLKIEEAEKEMRSFLLSSRLSGYHIVIIIHGKGLHSPGEAKLKNSVRTFLDTQVNGMIVRWKAAPLNQGGSGAVIVYL